MQTDWFVGQVMNALETCGASENTLLIFAADNGTSLVCDFDRLRSHEVDLQYHWRSDIADTFEGSHRVPIIVRRPGHIAPGTVSDQTVTLVDLMATCAEVLGIALPDNAAEDSVSLWPLLTGQPQVEPLHEAVICHSFYGVFAVRKGPWKLLLSEGSGGWSPPTDQAAQQAKLPRWQLYNLAEDPKETINRLHDEPKIVKNLVATLRRYVEAGRSTPGKPQHNHDEAMWWGQLPWKPNEPQHAAE